MVVKCMEISYVWDAMTMNTEKSRDASPRDLSNRIRIRIREKLRVGQKKYVKVMKKAKGKAWLPIWQDSGEILQTNPTHNINSTHTV